MEDESKPTGADARERTRRAKRMGVSPTRLLKATMIVLLPAIAVAIAWWATRPSRTTSTTADGMDHSTMGMAIADSAQPVMLDIESARRIGVTFAPVTSEVLRTEVRTIGQVTVDETRVRTMSLKVDGWVEQLYVNITGQRVERGQPLLMLYSPMLVTAQEELLLARKQVRDVSSGSEEARMNAADLAESARRRLRWWDISELEIARVERAGVAQRTLALQATATGIVLEKNVVQGQRIMAGETLFRVADLSSIWVDGEVYERDLRAVRVGQRVAAEFDALPGQQLAGRVEYVYPTLSGETRTARVRVAVPNPGLILKPGMYATLRIRNDQGGSTTTVPRSAVLATGERFIVFVRTANGQLEPRTVEIGGTSDERIEILRGVSVGDTVVASATFLVDAESNLGSALGGMANMPGMEITRPAVAPGDSGRGRSAPAKPPTSKSGDMPGMVMPPKPPAPGGSHGH